MNEELGPALTSQQGMAQPAVFSLLGAHRAGLRTYKPVQQFWAAVSEGSAHFPVISFPTPLRGPCGAWQREWGMGLITRAASSSRASPAPFSPCLIPRLPPASAPSAHGLLPPLHVDHSVGGSGGLEGSRGSTGLGQVYQANTWGTSHGEPEEPYPEL